MKVDYPALKIIVVDNCSDEDIAGRLNEEYRQVHVLALNKPVGFAAGNNLGLRRARELGAKYHCLLNNDTVVDEAFILALVSAAREHPRAAMLGAKIYYHAQPNRIWYAGGIVDMNLGRIKHRGIREYDKGQYERLERTGYVTGCCLFLPDWTLERVGYLDEGFHAYGEDTDWCIRAANKGFELLYVPSAIIWHKVSSSSGMLSAYKIKNRLKGHLKLLRRYSKIYYYPLIFVYQVYELLRISALVLCGRLKR